mgnify:FL=1
MNYLTAGIRVLYDRTSDYLNYYMSDISNNTQQMYRYNERVRIFDTIPMMTQFKTFMYNPTYIMDNIYLGSAYNASNKELLQSYNIRYIINITNEISNHFPDDFVYFNFKIQDNNKDRLFDFLEESYRKIKEYQNNNDGAILVHCFMGASRSATVVAHYIIKEHDYTPDLAIVFIKEKRIIVNLTNRLYNDLCEKYNKDKLMFQ